MNRIIRKENDIVNHFTGVISPRIRVFSSELSAGVNPGYDSKTKSYNIRVTWNTKMKIIGTGRKGHVSINPAAFAKQVNEYTPTLSEKEKDNIAANVLIHECIHSIYTLATIFKTRIDHENSGLMMGPPWSRSGFSIDEGENGLINFSETTISKLRKSVGDYF